MEHGSAADNAPLRQHEAEALLQAPGPGPVVLAVSGGPDSVALMLLASRVERLRGQGVTIATVDHGLRPEAAREVELVSGWAAGLNFRHVRLPWLGDRPPSAIQERARAARYALLAELARAIGAAQVAVAHHADDQAETVLMRLLRGSGPAGLAAMRPISRLGDLLLWRPLLEVPKGRLLATLAEAGHGFVEDPSNRDPRFERARLRALRPLLERHGLSRSGLARLAARAARADDALEALAEDAALRHLERHGEARFLRPGLWREPAEIQIRLLRRAIEDGPSVVGPRLERLERLHEALRQALAERRSRNLSIAGLQVALDRLGNVMIGVENTRRRGRVRVDATERSV